MKLLLELDLHKFIPRLKNLLNKKNRKFKIISRKRPVLPQAIFKQHFLVNPKRIRYI